MIKKTREDYAYSGLYKFIYDEGYIGSGKMSKSLNWYKKVDIEVILHPNLNFSDLAIYLAILKCSAFKSNFYTKISSEQIFEISGVNRTHQTRSFKKLIDLDIIHVRASRYENNFSIRKKPVKYLPLKLKQMNNIDKIYVRKLIGIMLSNGNNKIPTYKTCVEKMGKLNWREYKRILEVYNQFEFDDRDITNYISLECE